MRTLERRRRVPEGNRRASILHRATSVSRAKLECLVDRFVVHQNSRTTIDLATGERVELVVSTIGGVSEQARWACRCDRFHRLHHRSIARLLDYGPFGETRRFEAWRSDGPWQGPAQSISYAVFCLKKKNSEKV